LGAPPNAKVWLPDDIGGEWRPAVCTEWEPREFTVLVGTAARFRNSAGVNALLHKIAAVSKLATIQYWSVTRERWRPFITEAYALTGPDPDARRPDFSLEELQPGRTLYFWQDENTPAGEVVYRMIIRERSADRLVLEIENALPVRFLFLPLFGPGEYQLLYFLERESGDVWRYYSLTRVGGSRNFLARSYRDSYINRAVAVYRHLVGIPTDKEPPAAP
jgi:hypothetical protein